MKAFLLAAGVGSRLRPMTDTVPKCMLPVHGRPLLDLWLDALGRSGIDEVLVNLHHLPKVVTAHLEGRLGPPRVRLAFEPRLLGSAGTLAVNRKWVDREELFLVCYADNLTDFDLRSLVDAQMANATAATWAVFRSENPSRCGIVELDEQGTIVGFVEKPESPPGNLANAGMYAFHPSVLDEISGPLPKDIAYHLLPRLVGRSRAVTVEGYFRDIGTPDSYRRAREEWPSIAARSFG